MKMTQLSRLCISTIVFLLVLAGCIQRISKTETTYVLMPHKQPKDTIITYLLPDIHPTVTTKQMQTKGGVSISAEIIPFRVDSGTTPRSTIINADPKMPGYDVSEVAHIPHYTLSTDNKTHNIEFRLRIRNNEDVPLRLSEIGFAIIIDGLQFSFPQEQTEEWDKGIVLTGFERNDIIIRGPEFSGLNNAKVVYLFLNGVPTSYDTAGNITQKSNFEWYFQIASQTIQKSCKIFYTYEMQPVYTETCKACSGTGANPTESVCPICKGTGVFLKLTCSTCGGTGKVHYKCTHCSGTGSISFPKSPPPQIAGNEVWTGWKVKVVTRPAGATISQYNPQTAQYEPVKQYSSQTLAFTPYTINWYSGKVGGTNQYPILIEFNGRKVKALPVKKSGKPSPFVQVDFRGAVPIVKGGREVE